jgi:hypothetical protein
MYALQEVAAWLLFGVFTGFMAGYALGLKEGKREGFIRGKVAARRNAQIR